jgi:GT2 family glycosyltransferase
MLNTAIIILNYLEWRDTVKCIDSIRASSGLDQTIIVVDNASPNDSYEKLYILYENDDKVEIILSNVNGGYAAGNNIGLKYCVNAGYEFAIIANSDVIFHEGTIEKLTSYIANNKYCAVVGPNVMNSDGSFNKVSRIANRKLREVFFQNFRIDFFGYRSKVLSKYHYLHTPFTESHSVHMVSGCCFCLSLNFVCKYGYLDEGTFLYFEEPILGLKISKANWYAYHLGDAYITHFHGGSTKSVASFAFAKYVRSFIFYSNSYLNQRIIVILPFLLLFSLNFFIKSIYRPGFIGRNRFFASEILTQLRDSYFNNKDKKF